MNALAELHAAGQSIWLDSISRELLTGGGLLRYIAASSVTGLTSNPSIFLRAISDSADYDDAIKQRLNQGMTPEALFFELAIEDLGVAAQHFRPIFEATGGSDGFVSLEVSPELAHDAAGTVAQARRLHAAAGCDNLLIKVPGTAEGVAASEELIFAGVPVNVTLLFSTEHYEAAAVAYWAGLERRLAAGLNLAVPAVASLFISRWDTAVAARVPAALQHRTGIAVGHRAYGAFVRLHATPRWRRLAAAGARPQKLLWASTGTKDPGLPEGYYVTALAAADTINTLPEKTLVAFCERGEVGALLDGDVSEADAVIAGVTAAGVDLALVAARLQRAGLDAFSADFRKLLEGIAAKALRLA